MRRLTVLVVDDTPENLTLLREILGTRYQVVTADSGERALQLAGCAPYPDLVILDVMMPGMCGYQTLAALRSTSSTQDIPVIFTTAMHSTEAEELGLRLGAADFLTKPLAPSIVLARTHAQLEHKHTRDCLKRDKAGLEVEVVSKTLENQIVENVAIRALASLAKTRDNETGHHILRTQAYVEALAQFASQHPRYAHMLDERSISLIARSAPLHDIGKVGIPDGVLLKPGKLTPCERDTMKRHAELGAQALERAVVDAQASSCFLNYAIQIARHHHERWDGKGYPDRLAGDDIPLSARIMAIADVFDALISRRVYKEPMSYDTARDIMSGERGLHFDPDLLDLFLSNFKRFCEIADLHPDEERCAAADTDVSVSAA